MKHGAKTKSGQDLVMEISHDVSIILDDLDVERQDRLEMEPRVCCFSYDPHGLEFESFIERGLRAA